MIPIKGGESKQHAYLDGGPVGESQPTTPDHKYQELRKVGFLGHGPPSGWIEAAIKLGLDLDLPYPKSDNNIFGLSDGPN